MEQNSTVVIGAGPYGLSVASHLKAQGIPTRVFGKPMGITPSSAASPRASYANANYKTPPTP